MSKNVEEMPFLPDEMLTSIFAHLDVDDVKSCKLTCKRWYDSCRRDIITNREMLVFRYGVYSADEINKFLTHLDRPHSLNIELIAFNLKELNFRMFGHRIRYLRITDCFADDHIVVKNMFLEMPNLRFLYFNVVYSEDIRCSHTSFYNNDVLKRTFKSLKDEEFCNHNFETLEADDVILIGSDVYEIFPCIKNVSRGHDLSSESSETFPFQCGNSVETLQTGIYLNFIDLVKEPSSCSRLSKLPKLKILYASIELDPFKADVMDACWKFFADHPNLEKISLNLIVREKLCDVAKSLLFFLLRHCKELKHIELHMDREPRTDLEVGFNLSPDECKEFLQLISHVECLDYLNVLNGDMAAIREVARTNGPYLTRLKSLCLGPGSCRGNDLHWVLFEFSPNLRKLDLFVDVVQLRMDFEEPCDDGGTNLEQIMNSQKNLRSLDLTLQSPRGGLNNIKGKPSVQIIHHEKLESLQMNFTILNDCYIFTKLHNPIAWTFPNLLYLALTCDDDYQTRSRILERKLLQETKNTIINWVKTMPTCLKAITLPYRHFYMDVSDIAKLCAGQLNLKYIVWSSLRLPNNAEVINIYENCCPRLRDFVVIVFMGPENNIEEMQEVQYYYSRSKKCLYKAVKEYNGGLLPYTFTLAK